MDRAKDWFKTKVVEPGKSYIKHGAEPNVLARSAAVGFTAGLCPLLGVSAGLTCLLCFLSRGGLHAPMALLANLVSVPVELALIVPYMYIGEWITGAPHQKLAPVALKDLITHAPADVLKAVGRAILAWVLTWPLIAGTLYLIMAPAFRELRRRYARSSGSGADLYAHDSMGLDEAAVPHSTPLLPVGPDISTDGSGGFALVHSHQDTLSDDIETSTHDHKIINTISGS